jgi:hypothetical protein
VVGAVNLLLRLTFILWIVSIFGDQYAGDVFQQAYVQWPLNTILAFCLPVGFILAISRSIASNSLSAQNLAQPLFFIAIFLITIGNQVASTQNLSQKIQQLEQSASIELHPELLKQLQQGRTEKQREFVARMIYRSHGVALHYPSDSRQSEDSLMRVEELIKFSPNQVDKQAYQSQLKMLISNEQTRHELIAQQTQLQTLLLLQLSSFFILSALTLVSVLKQD